MISALAVQAYQRGEVVPTDAIPSTVAPEPQHYLTLIVDNPDAAKSPKAAELVNRAAICLRENQSARAFDLAKEAIELAPDNAEAWIAFGAASAGAQNWGEAITAYEKAAALKPQKQETTALAYLLRGNALAARGEFAGAIKAYTEALSINPNDADSYLNLGLAQSRLGRFQDSLETYERGLAVAPDDLEMQVVRGIMLASLGRREEAATNFRSAAEMADAGTVQARMAVSIPVIYDLAGRHEDGIQEYRRLADREPANADVNFLSAVVLFEAARFDEALPYFEKAIALEPTNADGHFFYGEALYGLRQWNAAVDAYDRALTLDPDYAGAYVRRGYALAQLQRGDDAIQSLDRALHGIAKQSVQLGRELTDRDRISAYQYLNQILSVRSRRTEDLQVLTATISVFDHIVASSPVPELRQSAASEKKYAALKILALLILDFLSPAMLDARHRTAFILRFLELLEVPESAILPSLEAVIREVTSRHAIGARPKKPRRPTWAKRRGPDRELTPPEFIKRHYADLIDAGALSLVDLANHDPSLYRAFHNWQAYRKRNKQSTEIGFDLPTHHEVTKRLIDRVIGSGILRPEEVARITGGLRWRDKKSWTPK
jgi:tetratricopeptide (TPR) repeat protein